MANEVRKLVTEIEAIERVSANAERRMASLERQIIKTLTAGVSGQITPAVQKRAQEIARGYISGTPVAQTPSIGGQRLTAAQIRQAEKLAAQYNLEMANSIRSRKEVSSKTARMSQLMDAEIQSSQRIIDENRKTAEATAQARRKRQTAVAQITPLQPVQPGEHVPPKPKPSAKQSITQSDIDTFLGDRKAQLEQLSKALGFKDLTPDTVQKLIPLENGLKRIVVVAKEGNLVLEKEILNVNRLGEAWQGKTMRPPVAKPTAASVKTAAEAFAGPASYEELNRQATAAGFSDANIKRIDDYAKSFQRYTYETKNADGVTRRFVATVDKAGNVMASSQKQFRTFFDQIGRNVKEMVMWSAATMIVWGSIRKLSEMIQIAIDNETKLAEIGVVLGKSQGQLDAIFMDAAEAAAATGESLNGVIEGYAGAYRATGGIANETARAATAQKLLIDSLMLSKLSSLNQAQAMDTLTGALRQAGLGLDKGSDLLDKWVKVSRYASVGVDTLAESFAITAGSASSAGVDVDKLNGIIAVLAESTTLSATEAGNAVRAFISGFTTDTAVKELGKFGIAVKTSSGEARGFVDVLEEIADMYAQGIISDEQLNQISRAIGGGARREAQVVTTIKNLARANEIAAVSASANGDAQRALNIQLETVQTSITKLSNSFQVLAKSIGGEGGVLGLTQIFLSVLDKTVLATASLTKNLGAMTIPLAAIAALFLTTSKATRGFLVAEQLGGLVGSLTGRGEAGQQQFGNWFYGPGIGKNAAGGVGGKAFQAGPQALTGAFAVGSAISAGVQSKSWEAAGTSLAGAALGALITGGNPLGIMIGSTIGTAFANATFGYKAEFSNFFKGIIGDATEEVGKEGKTPEERATSAVFADVGGNEARGKFLATLATGLGNFGINAAELISGAEVGPNLTPEQWALSKAGARAQSDVWKLYGAEEAQKGTKASASFGFSFITRQSEEMQKMGTYLDQLTAKEREFALQQAQLGQMNDKQLKDTLDYLPGLASTTTKWATAFGDAFLALNPKIQGSKEMYELFVNTILASNPEQMEAITSLVEEFAMLENAIDAATKAGENQFELEGKTWSVEEGRAELARRAQSGGVYLSAFAKNTALGNLKVPSIANLDVQEKDLAAVEDRARQYQEAFFATMQEEGLAQGLSYDDWIATFEPFFIQLGGDTGYIMAEKMMEMFLNKAAQDMTKAGEIIKPPTPESIGLQTFDFSSAELPGIMAKYAGLKASVEAQMRANKGFENWSVDEETTAALLNDNVAVPITADLTLLNIAMQELIDVNKKQLDGIYNLPTDASFYVPFSGYNIFSKGGGGGGGGGGPTAPYAPYKIEENLQPTGTWKDWWEKTYGPLGPLNTVEPLLTTYGPPAPTTEPEKYLEDFGLRHPGTEFMPQSAPKEIPDWWKKLTEGFMMGIDPSRAPAIDWGGILETILGIYGSGGTPGLGMGAGATLGVPGGSLFGPPAPTEVGGVSAQAGGGLLQDIQNMLQGLKDFSTSLEIRGNITTQLIVDGQVLANIVKPYLFNDTVRYEGTGGSGIKSFVI